MQKITFHLKPRSDARADGFSLVYIMLRIDGTPKEIPTHLYVPLKNWDRKNRCLKAGKGLTKKESLSRMLELEEILERCRGIRKAAFENGEWLDTAAFAKKLKTAGKNFEFIGFCRQYINENPDCWGSSTLHSYEGALKLLEDNYTAIYASDIPDFRKALEKKMRQIDNGPNTRKKRHTQFKSMLKRARKAGFQLADPYEEPIGIIRGNRNFLTVEELNRTIRFYQNSILPKGLQNTLRLFLWSCFTGCRYSDLEGLTQNNLVGDALIYIAEKTKEFNKRVEAPLPEVARVLIPNKSGRLFRVCSDQTHNRHLKSIFAQLGIRKHITFHCSRHTFATLYIYLGGDVTNLQQIMAHSSIETTMEYVKMAKRIDVTKEKLFDQEFAQAMRVITEGKSAWEAA